MLRAARIVIGIAVFLMGVTLVVFPIAGSPSFEQCVAKASQQEGTQPQKERPAYFFMSSVIVFRCTGKFLEENNVAVTALATVIIALFIGVLIWVATLIAKH